MTKRSESSCSLFGRGRLYTGRQITPRVCSYPKIKAEVLIASCLPEHEPVDLVNVAFAPSGSVTYQTPDRLSGIEAYEELKGACNRDWRLVLVDVPFEVSNLYHGRD